jgi:hypothetical protein
MRVKGVAGINSNALQRTWGCSGDTGGQAVSKYATSQAPLLGLFLYDRLRHSKLGCLAVLRIESEKGCMHRPAFAGLRFLKGRTHLMPQTARTTQIRKA